MTSIKINKFNAKFIIYILIIINIFYYNTFILMIIITLFLLNFFYSNIKGMTKTNNIPLDYDWELDKEFDEISYTQKSSLPRLEILASNNKISYESEKTIMDYVAKIQSFFNENKVETVHVRHTPGIMSTQILFTGFMKLNNNGSKSPAGLSTLNKLLPNLRSKLGIRNITLNDIIPGEKDVIGINVPNSKKDSNKLGLYGLLVSEDYKNYVKSMTTTDIINGLPITIGYTVSGQQLIYNLKDFPHLLICGKTGSGKSVLLNTIIANLLFVMNPHNLQLLLVDPKKVELAPYEGLPHLNKPILTDITRINNVFLELLDEHSKRNDKILEAKVKNIWEYNNKKGTRKLPYMVVIIDELAEVLLTSDKEIHTNLIRLLQLTRSTGIHFILCTQRPSVDIIPASMKAQTAKIALKVENLYDSKTILDVGGAESLNGKGDGLIKIEDELLRFQAPIVSTEEITSLIKEWERLWKHQ